MPENQPGNDKLDSWKEIAAYLNRDVRTVIRWEKKRNLPVHRLPGGQAVFAYKVELDDWLKQGTSETAPSDGTPRAMPLRESPPPSQNAGLNLSPVQRIQWQPLWGYMAILGAVGILIAVLAGTFVHRSTSASASIVASVKFFQSSIQALDDAGRVMWTHELSNPIHPEVLKHKEGLESLIRIIDLFKDGGREILVTLPLQISPNPADPTIMKSIVSQTKGHSSGRMCRTRNSNLEITNSTVLGSWKMSSFRKVLHQHSGWSWPITAGAIPSLFCLIRRLARVRCGS